jgi:hypothetical protein
MPVHVGEDGKRRWTRVVYVIELDREACSHPSSPCQGHRCGRIPVYVGETALTRAERFAQHRDGIHASPAVKKYGLCLRGDLALGFGEMASQEESKAAERKLFLRLSLEEAGTKYCVYGGH